MGFGRVGIRSVRRKNAVKVGQSKRLEMAGSLGHRGCRQPLVCNSQVNCDSCYLYF